MKTMLRVLSLVLAIMMVATTFIACKKDDGNKPDDEGDKVINWEGEEYRVLGREYENNMFTNFEIDRETMPEDVVGIAVWNRNAAIKEKYGLDVVGTLVTGKPENEAKLFLEAGEDAYDLILCTPNSFHPFAMQGYLLDLKTLDYVDITKDCWNEYANTQLTMGGKLFYTTNKFLLHDKHRTWMVFYNRDLAKDLNIGYLETEVFDGKWTMDRLIEIAKLGAAEKDGVDGMSYYDQWGVGMSDSYCFTQLALASGFRFSDHGNNGYPQLIGATDQMVTVLDKVFELTADDNTCFIHTFRPESDKIGLDNSIFSTGNAVVLVDVISSFDDFAVAGITFDLGTIPNPKFNEDQEDYYSAANVGNGTLLGVPATVYDPAKAGFGLQVLAEESVATSYDAYIETKCKLQDVYDEDGAKCLDIIFEGVVYDIAQIANFGGLCDVLSNMARAGVNNYTSQFKKYEKKANNEITKLKEAYEKLDQQ